MKLKDSKKERAIIDQTLDIVYETGIAGIKMSALAKRVGISPSTLYVYFENKEDLIVSIGLRLLKQINETQETTDARDTSFEQKFRAMWMDMLSFMLDYEKERNFLDQWKQSPYFDKVSLDAWNDHKKVNTALLQEGRETGIFKSLNNEIIHAVGAGIADQVVGLVKQGSLNLDESTKSYLSGIVWDALKK